MEVSVPTLNRLLKEETLQPSLVGWVAGRSTRSGGL